MEKDNSKSSYKKFILLVVGFLILTLGISLILVWWRDVIALSKGAIGIIFALSGLLTLYALNK